MTALLELPPIVGVMKSESPPCQTDGTAGDWCAAYRGHRKFQQRAESRAVKACRTECHIRGMCAMWGFEMEEFCIFGGYTAPTRSALRERSPEKVRELTMLVKALVNLHDPRATLRRGKTVEVDDEVGAFLVARGYAEAIVDNTVSKGVVVDVVEEVLAELDVEADAIEAEQSDSGNATTYAGAYDDDD